MKKVWLTLVTVSLGLTACNDNQILTPPTETNPPASAASSSSSALPVYASQIEQASAPAEVKPAVSSGNFLADAAALQAAEDALKALPQFGGKPVNVFQTIHFYGGSHPRITVDIQDPGKPDNIDHYEFEDGKWGDPVPVRISGDGRMKDNVFPLNEIKFANIAKIAQTFSEKATEVGAEETTVDHVYYSLFVPTGEKKWYTSDIKTPRAEYEFEFNKDGSLKSFKKR